MTIAARNAHVCARQWEQSLIVIPIGRCPGCGRVTGRAVVIETGQHMIRLGNSRIVAAMAGVAIRRGPSVARRMATVAVDRLVCAGKREGGQVVIEIPRNPGVGGMAEIALSWEAGLNVVRIDRPEVVGLVAYTAFSVRAGESGRMAIAAYDALVCAGEFIGGIRVIELGW